MFQRFHKMREEGEKGFTLIELLVVILIIAILAAIAIPVFLAQRKKGWNGQVQSALKNAATAAESHATGANGSYLALDGADGVTAGDELLAEGFKAASTVDIAVTATATDYCIVATHSGGLTDPDDDWAVASYDSDEGEPAVDNAC